MSTSRIALRAPTLEDQLKIGGRWRDHERWAILAS